jgi:hypothetical protein
LRQPATSPARSQQPAAERQRARLRALQIAWERRGMPWDEQAALRVLRESDAVRLTRGEVRITRGGVQVR